MVWPPVHSRLFATSAPVGEPSNVHEPLELALDPVGPLGHGRDAVQRAFAGVTRVADHPGGAAREHDRPGARLLEAAQREQRDEVARVQAGGGRVEPAVEREHARGRSRRNASVSVLCATRPRHSSSSRTSVLTLSNDPPRHTWARAAPAGPGRYGLTAADSASQNRHGVSCAAATPTRGPVRTDSGATGTPRCSRTRDAGSVRSSPLSARFRPSSAARRAGPRARSAARRAVGPPGVRAARSETTSPARSSTAPGRPRRGR